MFELEQRRHRRMEGLATLLQKIYKGWKAYSRFQQMRDSAILIETQFRGYKVKKKNKHTQLSRVGFEPATFAFLEQTLITRLPS